MTGEDLYRSINALEDETIEKSENPAAKEAKKRHFKNMQTAVACAVGAALVIMGAGYAGITLHNMMNRTDGRHFSGGQQNLLNSQDKTLSDNKTLNDNTPINYSDLKLADSASDKELVKIFAEGASSIDISAFDESMLADCVGIVEGEITDIYLKQYSYDIFDDKFEIDGILHAKAQTVVYEINVDNAWYGEYPENSTVIIEDMMFFPEEIFALKKGRRYVIPFYNVKDTIYTGVHRYAGGDIKRDSIYSTVYMFHPQIEVTQDNCYIISEDWKTLSFGGMQKIIMDTDNLEEGSFYRDKMGLLTTEVFKERMNKLISEVCCCRY